jgi:hypothetical protein
LFQVLSHVIGIGFYFGFSYVSAETIVTVPAQGWSLGDTNFRFGNRACFGFCCFIARSKKEYCKDSNTSVNDFF